MTKVTCPTCKQLVDPIDETAEALPPELDDRGVPYACSVQKGFGLPVVMAGQWAIFLDGEPVKRCVAFDRKAGAIWHYPEGPNGQMIRLDNRIHVERRDGVVMVQPLDRRAS